MTKPDNNTQDRFVHHWRQYQGIGGFVRYASRFLLLGLLLSPVVLFWLNPKMLQQLLGSRWVDALVPLALLIAIFALLPALAVATMIWRRQQKRFMQLTTEQARYLPFEKRIWATGEAAWKRAIGVMVFLAGVSAVVSFGLVLGHNAPAHHAYPFVTSAIFLVLHTVYQFFMVWWAEQRDGALYIPATFKILLAASFLMILIAWAWFLVRP